MTYRHDLWEIAADKHAIVTTAEAEDWGVPAVEVRKLAARGALTRVGHGVYRHNAVPAVHPWTGLRAKLAIVGHDAFLEGDTVLSTFDLAQVNPPKYYIGTLRRRRTTPPPHTAVTFRPATAAEDLTTYEGLRSVTVRRALLDAVPIVLTERLLDAVDAAQRRDLITEPEATEITDTVTAWNQRLFGFQPPVSPWRH
ncbi:Uncharacterised protein [Mycobacteroides abscessus subsp. massiliense]|uniref:type IV toxin-antitoxin system AbiEi family antitoxin domain-containing protein n=1 Tax=Mycobacteroides abscessus TaxID=36809 RepID=UPI0009A8294A|nr:type IV toxin-antitoxin system AbiEi family antitoxin domain-containing protein [Mycobacteroides abscessus]SKL10407.1 Uncharacterised protein [Mycobacteroides abscessus subsp. massiliense]